MLMSNNGYLYASYCFSGKYLHLASIWQGGCLKDGFNTFAVNYVQQH